MAGSLASPLTVGDVMGFARFLRFDYALLGPHVCQMQWVLPIRSSFLLLRVPVCSFLRLPNCPWAAAPGTATVGLQHACQLTLTTKQPQCRVMQCNAVQSGATQCNMINCKAKQSNGKQCSVVQCIAMQYNAIAM